MKTTNNIKAAIKYFLLVAFAIVTLFPFYWMIASSLKSSFEVIQTRSEEHTSELQSL